MCYFSNPVDEVGTTAPRFCKNVMLSVSLLFIAVLSASTISLPSRHSSLVKSVQSLWNWDDSETGSFNLLLLILIL